METTKESYINRLVKIGYCENKADRVYRTYSDLGDLENLDGYLNEKEKLVTEGGGNNGC